MFYSQEHHVSRCQFAQLEYPTRNTQATTGRIEEAIVNRIVAANTGAGRIVLVEEAIPPLRPGTVLVEVHNSLVSPGTEIGGWRGLARQLDDPKPRDKPRPFGYSNAGIVMGIGEGVTRFAPGDRIACIGGGYAQHADVAVVPHNLCVPIPEKTTFAQGAYAMLAATGLHAVRRLEPEIGEYVAVVGMGLVGQLTARLLQLSGCYVIGWDMIPQRLEIARSWGIDATALSGQEDEIEASSAFTGGYGLDAAVFAYGGDATEPFEKVRQALKRAPDGHPYGCIVIVGGAHFQWTSGPVMTNVDVRQASRTGPGYHDDDWEVGPSYPPVFMRWTTQTNLELCMRLISEGKLDVDALTTHTIPLRDVEASIAAILHEPDDILGVIFEMSH